MFASCEVLLYVWFAPGTYPQVALYTSLPGLTYYGHGSLRVALILMGVSFGGYMSYHMLGGSELLLYGIYVQLSALSYMGDR